MIDFHTHILPEIDDGSENVHESIELLKILASQKVKYVVATPHYSIRSQSDTEFLKKRKEAYEKLLSTLPDKMPKIFLGAEVEYFSGISRSDFVKNLRIEGTKFLLLEMPFYQWTDKTVTDVLQLCCREGIVPVLAHIERYFKYSDFYTLQTLSDNGVLFQMNCSALSDRETRRKTTKLIDDNLIQFVGTDCHYLPGRMPNMDKFIEYTSDKFGSDFIKEFFNKQIMLFKSNVV